MPSVAASRRYLIPFRSTLLPQIFTDTLIIGSGVAGMRAAIAAGEFGEVIMLGKSDVQTSNTAWAQGGIAAVTGAGDTAESHVTDTLVAGAGLCDEPVVKLVIERGIERVRELIDWGMRFDTSAEGTIKLGREGGHSLSRILHADGDATGRELVRCLWQKVKALPSVRIFNACFAIDLLSAPGDGPRAVMGAITHHPKFGLQVIWAKSTILATGGTGMLYRESTNPRSATGDGIAMAYRAGASSADMAFVQFHPTTLYLAGAARSLITEAVRGEGAYLVDDTGDRFMLGEHPMAELAPRDIVTRAIVRRLATRGTTHAFLDCRHISGFATKFPGISALLAKFELSAQTQLIPIHPAAHYQCGGIVTDELARTNLPGLFVAGESACTGLHGANRLASNSLLEGLVFGEIAGLAAAAIATGNTAASKRLPPHENPGWALPPRSGPLPIVSTVGASDAGELDLEDVERSLRSAMWRNIGIERSGTKLDYVNDMISFWARYTQDKVFDDVRGWQVQNMLMAAALIAKSARWRQESRGCHWRSDFPHVSRQLRAHDVWTLGQDGPTLVPVRMGPLSDAEAGK